MACPSLSTRRRQQGDTDQACGHEAEVRLHTQEQRSLRTHKAPQHGTIKVLRGMCGTAKAMGATPTAAFSPGTHRKASLRRATPCQMNATAPVAEDIVKLLDCERERHRRSG